jgi:small subunit ribosomal protein S13
LGASRVARLTSELYKMQEKQDKMENKQEIKHLVRIANTDLQGPKQLHVALTKIKGISFMLSNIICNLAKIDKAKKVGTLSDDEVSKIDSIIKEPLKYKIPTWALNRRDDPETSSDMHLLGPDIKFVKENDIKIMKKMKSYKGMRHAGGLPVRGQKTKANFRRNKGRSSLGVKRKKSKSGKV